MEHRGDQGAADVWRRVQEVVERDDQGR
jgi:hypothetical protein